jgi:hypothetical protein
LFFHIKELFCIFKSKLLKTNYSFFLLALFLCLSATSQIVNIPDAVFKNLLISTNVTDTTGNGSVNADIDLNNDGEIQRSEADVVTNLFLGFNTNITSLEGVQFFTNLEKLIVNNSQVAFVPILTITSLENISLSDNQITSIDVTNLPNLKNLFLFNNQVSSIDVSNCPLLFQLSLGDNNISSLDVSQNPSLISLTLNNNPIMAIDVSLNPNINELNVENTLLTQLDVSTQLGFLQLSVINTPLTSLTGLTNKIGFDFIFIENTQLTSLNIDNVEGGVPDIYIANNPLLNDITISNSTFLNFRIDNNPSLITLTAFNNDINDIVTNGNALTQINIENNKAIGYMSFTNENQLIELNSNNTLAPWGIDITDCSMDRLLIKNGVIDNITFSGTNSINYICADTDEILAVSTATNNNGITNVNLNTYCTFAPGGDLFKITGDVRIDADLNGCSVSDTRFTDFKFTADNGTSSAIFFESPGYDYEIAVPEGNYTITTEPVAPSLYNPLNSYTANFAMGDPDIIQDICLTPNGNIVDLAIVMDEILPARPGFTSGYRLICSNVGTAAINGTVFLNYNDNLIQFQGSSDVLASNNNRNLSWNLNTLQPGDEYIITVDFRVNSPMDTPAVNGGDILVYNGSIAGPSGINDVNTLNNTFEFAQTVVNSFDPNDITCLQGEILDPGNVGQDLHYKIRFENTGTASAINVVVRNEIDLTKLDINTFIPLTSSHPIRTRITDGNLIEFIFEDINLDFNDATNDGYLIYKIKSLPSLQLGDVIANQAGIYFDFNFPIITNDYMVTVAQTASLNDADLNLVTLFPNPANNEVTLESLCEIEMIKIYDHLGRIVKIIYLEQESFEKTLDISNLKTGLYFIEVEDKNGRQSLKLIKE